MRSPFRQPSWLAVLLAAAVLLPFLNTAYTVDDPVFLTEAQYLPNDLLHPASVEVVWSANHRGQSATPYLPDARIAAYFLRPLVLVGWRECGGHLLVLGYFATLIVGTVVLAARLGLGPSGQRAAGLLTASAPVALGMARTLSPDIPATMLAVWGVERLLVYADTRRWRIGLASALLLALAGLGRLHLIALVGLALLWALGQSRNVILFIVLSLSLTLVGVLVMRDPALGRSALGGQGLMWRPMDHVLPNVIAFDIFLITTTPVILSLVAQRANWAPSGLLWLWLLVPLPVLGYVHFPAKFLVPIVPPASILAASGLEHLRGRLRHLLLALTVTTGVGLGCLILTADARMAGSQRDAATTLIAPRVAEGERVWYAGHWGFHWYAERVGAIPLALEPPYPSPGDILVESTVDQPGGLLCVLPRTLLATAGDTAAAGRVIGRRAHAGFYSNFWGPLPWGWGPPDAVPFRVWRVTGEPGTLPDSVPHSSWCSA